MLTMFDSGHSGEMTLRTDAIPALGSEFSGVDYRAAVNSAAGLFNMLVAIACHDSPASPHPVSGLIAPASV